MGKGRQVTRAELEKNKFNEMTVEQALPLVARMIVLSHKETREKRFELEASWICPHTNNVHKLLDIEKRKALEKAAEEQIEKEMIEE